MSWEQQTSSVRTNMYTGLSNAGVTPPIPPRESSIPFKAIKTPPPEVKKKKAKRIESSRIKDVSTKTEKESSPIPGYSTQTVTSKFSGSRENVVATTAPPSQEMTLMDFVKAYSCQFPQRIKIINGYCGNSNRLTISANDIYNIHLLKHVRVAKVMDMIGNEYSVPVNTAIEFGLVFDPVGENRGSQQAVSGFNLRVSDIFSLSTLPKVLCCVSGWSSPDGSISLTENELLAIRGVQKTRLKNKKFLKVYSLLDKKEVMIPDHCMALFSTRPRLLKMTLKDLVENIPDPFPNPATVHFADELYHNPTTAALIQDMSDRFLSDIVRILRIETESSLIASAVYPEGFPVDEYPGDQVDEYVDIPLEGELLNIEVSAVETDEFKIYDDTLTIYEKFNPAMLKSMKEMSSNQASAAQSLFYVAVKEGMEKHGVQLDEPTAAYVSMTAKQFSTEKQVAGNKRQNSKGTNAGDAEASDDDSDGYETIYHEIEGRGSFPVIGGSGSAEGKHMSGSGSGVVQSPGGNTRQLPSFLLKKPKSNASVAPPPPPPPPPPHPPAEPMQQLSPSSPNTSHSNNPQRHEQQANSYEAYHSHVSSSFQPQAPLYPENQEERLKQKLPLPEKTPSPLKSFENQLKSGTMPRLNQRLPETKSTEEGKSKLKALEARLDKLESMIDLLERASRKEQEEMSAQIKELNSKLEVLQLTPNRGIPKEPGMNSSEVQTNEGREKNREVLSKLTVEQILIILENMELSKHTKVFQAEQITGDILLELTDDLLKDELGVQSKIHRIRIMKVVTGEYSPYQYMS